ncbi:MAG: tetratricopeptide repeat protein [Singulisphaera sp.]
MELGEAAGDWARSPERRSPLAVNRYPPPANSPAPRNRWQRDEAIAAYRALSLLDETDPAEVHFRLARLLHQAGKKDEARREVLKSLEQAPRFLDAHRLLLDLIGPEGAKRGLHVH